MALTLNARYFELYVLGLRLSHYNFLLNDYSYFQFGWIRQDTVRYAYFPNPCLSGNEQALEELRGWREDVEAGELTHEELLENLRGELPEMRIPLIRYENAPSQYAPHDHPCSHFHIGHHFDNRWAAARILTPFAFTLLILKQYYGDAWRSREDDDPECNNSLDRKLIEERETNCRILGEELFSASERRSFHLS